MRRIKRIFELDNILSTIFVMGVMFFFTLLPDIFKVFDPLAQALDEIDITDLAFTSLKEDREIDTNIVIINLGPDRASIARQLDTINKYKPAVIGIDALFYGDRDPESDSALYRAVQNSPNLVMACEFNTEEDEDGDIIKDTLSLSNSLFHPVKNSFGFINLKMDKSFRTIRTFFPFKRNKDTTITAFPVLISKIYNESKYRNFLKRGNATETINFRGDFLYFNPLSNDMLMEPEFDKSFLKGKIVLLGYAGREFFEKTSIEDKFFTPLNENYIGRAIPDMYGIVIHANVISMILNENYVWTFSHALILLITFILVLINISLYQYIKRHFEWLYGGEIKIFVFLQIIISLFITYYLFERYRVKIEPTIIIFALLLAPDLSEMYFSSVKRLFDFLKKRVFKMKFATSIIAIILLSAAVLSAQDNWKYKVVIADGKASLLKSAKDEKKLFPRTLIYPGDKLKIEKGGFVALSDKGNFLVELKEPGLYDINQLKRSKNNLPEKYVNFIISSLEEKKEEKLIGGVMRATPSSIMSQVRTISPSTTKLLEPQVQLSWMKFPGAQKYSLVLLDNKHNKLLTKEVSDTTASVDLAPYRSSASVCVYWAVMADGDENSMSESHCLYLLNEEETANIKAELQSLESGLPATPALKSLIIANFYEANGLMTKAEKHYIEAVAASGESDAYKKAYENFKIKNK